MLRVLTALLAGAVAQGTEVAVAVNTADAAVVVGRGMDPAARYPVLCLVRTNRLCLVRTNRVADLSWCLRSGIVAVGAIALIMNTDRAAAAAARLPDLVCHWSSTPHIWHPDSIPPPLQPRFSPAPSKAVRPDRAVCDLQGGIDVPIELMIDHQSVRSGVWFLCGGLGAVTPDSTQQAFLDEFAADLDKTVPLE